MREKHITFKNNGEVQAWRGLVKNLKLKYPEMKIIKIEEYHVREN